MTNFNSVVPETCCLCRLALYPVRHEPLSDVVNAVASIRWTSAFLSVKARVSTCERGYVGIFVCFLSVPAVLI